MVTEAVLSTEQGKQYLNKLCRYFSRHVPTTIVGLHGRINLPSGLCRILVSNQNMHLSIVADNEHDIDKAERIVEEQLLRITRKDSPSLKWKRQD